MPKLAPSSSASASNSSSVAYLISMLIEAESARCAPPGFGALHRSRVGLLPELGVVEPLVGAVGGQQFGVRALLDDAALFHDEDQVGVADRRQPVRDDEARAVRPQSGH